MGKIWTFLLFLALIALSHSLYDKYSSVQSITASDFSQVKKGVWLVEFYAPWCGHCRNLAPEYEKAAKALKGIANIAAVDADKERTQVQIQGFPTIKLFVDGKMSDYDGPRTAEGIVDFMFRKLRNIANERLGGGSSSSGRSDYSSGGFDQKDVFVLTDSNFEENVYGDEAPWFVEFYAPWCGHCKNLAPQWAEMASSLKGQVKVAKVDATENKEVASRFGVQGYPTIKFFPGGKKDDGSAIDYNGPRSAAGMTEWAIEQTKDLKHFEHIQLTSQQVYDDSCKGRNLCVLFFLPHILDSSPEERESYLDHIKEIGLKFRAKPFKFLWAQAGDHFELEEKLGAVGVGYPVTTVIYESKKYFGKLRKAFSEENVQNYLNEILSNKARMNKLPPFQTLETVPEYGAESEEGCTRTKCSGEAQQNEQSDL